ncbi:putative origin recognition complex subunit 2 protein [Phaeoacremonium minimum UCRPA7]|uniref:Origin recognition complex subunit 2 n=1 Tax=Phaeoacremonium minimum (strain UCR-PA7) TaxID=1286976 RepID=R8BDT8_PHAM7|nr:putative origin recognition complex subunit 2 protein [Phaeoacremonium minimum UCRPA7]EON97468.1 putative origin recognition complex subunit 2 protein [Phaeoacremonium minimum UCRPA7]
MKRRREVEEEEEADVEDGKRARSTRAQRHRKVFPDEIELPKKPTPSKRRRASKPPEPENSVEHVDEEMQEPVNNGPDTTLEPRPSSEEDQEPVAPTPTKRRRGRPPKNATASAQANGKVSTPSKSRIKNIETPVKKIGLNGTDTPSRRNIADRSARRKSARALIDRVVTGGASDDEGGDDDLERQIYESSESDDEEEQGNETDEAVAATPSKTPRGRKKRATRKKSPTPPRDLPAHEMYFYQNKPGLTRTSNNTLASLDLLTHDEYFSLLREYKDPHAEDIEFLQGLHAESFPQWTFELAEDFSICLYGYGSKRPLLHRFAKHLFAQSEDKSLHKIVIVNGYVRTFSIREMLTTLGNAIDPTYKVTAGIPVAMVRDVLSLLKASGSTLTIVLNSVDALPLRKGGVQSILAQLASHPQIRLICSADTPDFALLWDSGLRSSFNFVFHDCTTFAPFSAEIEVVDEVHELLGRKARRVGGKDGVIFVLRSLPENAKNLFRLLVSEALITMEDDGVTTGESVGVEYRMLYNKAVEEFICSSEMAFRTLLKE